MTSIANAVMFYGFMKYAKSGTYPIGQSIMFCAVVDTVIVGMIMIGVQ